MTNTIQVSGVLHAGDEIAVPERYALAIFGDRIDSLNWSVSGKELSFELKYPLIFDNNTTVGAMKRLVMTSTDNNVEWTFRTDS